MALRFTVHFDASLGVKAPDVLSIALAQPRMLIGRGADADVRLAQRMVSARHALVEVTTRGFSVTDLDSTAGTAIDGRRLVAGRKSLLSPGSSIDIGPFRLAVEAIPVVAEAADQSAPLRFARQLLAALEPELGRFPYVEVLKTPQASEIGSRLMLTPPDRDFSIGRAEASSLSLHDSDISRTHVILRLRGTRVTLEDCRSKNGTRVQGTIVGSQRLHSGDLIKIGDTLLRFTDELAARLETIAVGPDDSYRGSRASPALSAEASALPYGTNHDDIDAEEPNAATPLPLFAQRGAPEAATRPGIQPTVSWFERIVIALALGLLGASLLSLIFLLGLC